MRLEMRIGQWSTSNIAKFIMPKDSKKAMLIEKNAGIAYTKSLYAIKFRENGTIDWTGSEKFSGKKCLGTNVRVSVCLLLDQASLSLSCLLKQNQYHLSNSLMGYQQCNKPAIFTSKRKRNFSKQNTFKRLMNR